MAHRVVRRMLSLLLTLDGNPEGMALDNLCLQVGYTGLDEIVAWEPLESALPSEREAHVRIRERARKALREDLERLRQLGCHIREDRRLRPGDADYSVTITLEERPFIPVTLELDDVATVVEWAARIQAPHGSSTGLPLAAIEFSRAAKTGAVLRIDRNERSWIVHPWQLVIRGERHYGVGTDLKTNSVRTLRLDSPDITTALTGQVLGPAADDDINVSRLVDPLTWGDRHMDIRLTMSPSQLAEVRSLLSPAIVDATASPTDGLITVVLSVSDLSIAAERIVPLLDRITVDSVELRSQLHRIAEHLDAKAPWIPRRILVPPMSRPPRPTTTGHPNEPLAPPGPLAPSGRRDSTSDTGALLLALNSLGERDGTHSISEVADAAGRTPREVVRLLATFLDLRLDTNAESSSSPPFILLDDALHTVTAERALQAPLLVTRVRGVTQALADLGRSPMGWRSLCSLLIKALELQESQFAPEVFTGDLDLLISDLERRLGIDVDQLSIIQDSEPSAVDLEALRQQWTEWSRAQVVLGVAFRDQALGITRLADVQPVGTCEDGRLVGIDAHRVGLAPESRVVAVAPEYLSELGDRGSWRIGEKLTDEDRARAIQAAELTCLVTLAIRSDLPEAHDALATLRRLWQADIIQDVGCYVAMIRLPSPPLPALELLLVEHPSVLRVVAPDDLVATPTRVAARIRATLAEQQLS